MELRVEYLWAVFSLHKIKAIHMSIMKTEPFFSNFHAFVPKILLAFFNSLTD